MKIFKNFTTISSKFIKDDPYVIQPALDLFENKFRRIGLEHTVLDKRKIIVPIKRMRTQEDTLVKLHPNHESPGILNRQKGYIEARDDFPELDFVLDNRQIFSILGMKNQEQTCVFLKNENEEHRVILKDVKYSSLYDLLIDNNWIAWTKFQRYIVGKPNLIWLPISIRQGFSNPFMNKGIDYTKKVDGVWVYSYSDTYMVKFDIDPQYVTYQRGFKMADLMRCLPYGMKLHEKHMKQLGTNLLTIDQDQESYVEDHLRAEMKRKKIESGEFKPKSQLQQEAMIKGKKVKKDKVLKNRSLKKKLIAQSADIKKSLKEMEHKEK